MRTVRIRGACLSGAGAELVTVEARFAPAGEGRTEIVLTGLPDPVLRESRGRLSCALEETGCRLEPGRLYLNLVPAARRKSGEILDLPLAVGAVAALGHVDARALRGTLFLGELGIDGTLHGVPGGVAAAMAARAAGLARVVAPPATAAEAAALAELAVYGARTLAQVLAHVARPEGALPRLAPPEPAVPPEPACGAGASLDDVRGQAVGKRALVVAATGGHGLLFVGPPGAGKSLLARRLVELLPAPELEERLAITCVQSAAGRFTGGLLATRPFRAPHHTTSYAGLVGGGPHVAPGEITLAHGGVLFLDELPEFRREALEALRQPLESGAITLSRATRRVELPARFQLVAAMNPCPCGHLGDARVPCTCSPHAVERYRRRISGPLLDRIDLCVELAPPSVAELVQRAGAARGSADAGTASSSSSTVGGSPAVGESAAASGPTAAEARAQVAAAVARQRARQGALANKDLGTRELDRWAPVDPAGRELLERASRRLGLSARGVQSVRRVARTLADLEGADLVEVSHLAQAVALRSGR